MAIRAWHLFIIFYLITSIFQWTEANRVGKKFTKRTIPNLYPDFGSFTDDTMESMNSIDAMPKENDNPEDCNPGSFMINGNGNGYANANDNGYNNGNDNDNINSFGNGNSYGNSHGYSQGIDNSNSKESINIAQEAAEEAKAATDAQQAAGQEASKQAKLQLAEKALQAAKAAEAALAGKQQILEKLESELHEAEAVAQEESHSLKNVQQSVNAAVKSSELAQQQLKMITQLVQLSQEVVASTEQAANGAQKALQEKIQLLEAAKVRIGHLLKELRVAKTDFFSTKQAAYKAACAARDAKMNAQRARRQMAKRNFHSNLEIERLKDVRKQKRNPMHRGPYN